MYSLLDSSQPLDSQDPTSAVIHSALAVYQGSPPDSGLHSSFGSLPSVTTQSQYTSGTDIDIKYSTDCSDDDFFNVNTCQKERSASFGGITQYTSQFADSPQRYIPHLGMIAGSANNSLYDSAENVGRLGASSAASAGLMHSPEEAGATHASFSPSMVSPVQSGGVSAASGGSDSSDAGANAKKSTSRRNAWGNLSYADLITQAIMHSPEKRLTLSQVYEWMVQNVPYFANKGDSNSSAGWKNSIRHNLSLHSRFMRIQNEGAGKSSWWVINPDAKPGRNPRRQRASTIDSTTKSAIDKKRGRASRKVKDMRIGLHSGVSSLAGSTASVMSHDVYGDDEAMQASFDPMFRARTQSNISMPGSSARVSPTMDGHTAFDDFDFPPWVEGTVPIPSDILDRTDQIRIDSCRPMSNGMKQQTEQKPQLTKSDSGNAPPPSYHELNSVRGASHLQNPLLRNHQLKFHSPASIPLYSYPWMQQSPPISSHQSCAAQQSVSAASGNALPVDLENLTLPDQPLMEMDVESLLRQELSLTRDHQINFDI